MSLEPPIDPNQFFLTKNTPSTFIKGYSLSGAVCKSREQDLGCKSREQDLGMSTAGMRLPFSLLLLSTVIRRTIPFSPPCIATRSRSFSGVPGSLSRWGCALVASHLPSKTMDVPNLSSSSSSPSLSSSPSTFSRGYSTRLFTSRRTLSSQGALQDACSLARIPPEGSTFPNPQVGCVLIDGKGAVIGEGFHPQAGFPHAVS